MNSESGVSEKRYWSVDDFVSLGVSYETNRYGAEFVESIISAYKKNKSPLGSKLRKLKELRRRIVSETSFLDKAIGDGVITKFGSRSEAARKHAVTIAFRVYCIFNDICGIEDFPKCPTCGKVLPNFYIDSQGSTHHRFCSQHCNAINEDLRVLRGKIQRQRPDEEKLETKRRREDTNERRHGNRCFMKTKRFLDAKQSYIIENGGETNVSQIKEVRERVIATNMRNCGYSSNLASPECIAMKRKTYMKNYGADHNMRSKTGYAEWQTSFIENNGVCNPFCLPSAQAKSREFACEKKIEAILCNEHVRPMFDVFKEKNRLELFGEQYWWECMDCGHVFAARAETWSGEYITKCPFCSLFNGIARNHSNFEFEVAEFVRGIAKGMRVICGDNSVNRHVIPPYELDVYVPDMKLAVECEGLLWHSCEFAEMHGYEYENRMLMKTEMCEKLGIHLIHVYQDEWYDEHSGVKDTVRRILESELVTDSRDVIVLPRDKFPVFYKVPGYELTDVTDPVLVQRHYKNRSKLFTLYDCGNLVYRRVNTTC